jgi:hypothetical protein
LQFVCMCVVHPSLAIGTSLICMAAIIIYFLH